MKEIPEWLIAVDPGTSAVGISLWRSGELVAAEWLTTKEKTRAQRLRVLTNAVCVWVSANTPMYSSPELIVERPQLYDGRASQGDGNDLIDLAMVVGALLGSGLGVCFDDRHTILPREWKGGIPKPKRVGDPYIVEIRLRHKLTEEELTRVKLPKAEGKHHNVWDAIGIGAKRLGRF